MAKEYSDSERENPLLPHGLLFSISSKGSFICIISTYRIIHTTAFVTVLEHWLECEIAQWVHHEGLIRQHSYHGATPRSTLRSNEINNKHIYTSKSLILDEQAMHSFTAYCDFLTETRSLLLNRNRTNANKL